MSLKSKSKSIRSSHRSDKARISPEVPTQCVWCKSRIIRKIGKGQYFCSDCCTEFVVSEKKVKVFLIREDGGLMKIS